MKLLDEIIELATGDEGRLSILLRKCVLLADKLENDELEAWAWAELKGYGDQSLPEYRQASIIAKGFLVGPGGQTVKNQPLPASNLEKEHRHWANSAQFSGPIATYESLLEGESESLAWEWPGDLVALYQFKFIKGFALNRAWKEIPPSVVIGMCETIRNRIFEFALELRKQVGESENPEEVISREQVAQAVTNIIFGGNNIIGNVSGNASQSNTTNVVAGDFNSLSSALKCFGVPQSEIDDLPAAVEADKEAGDEMGLGTRTLDWITNAAGKVVKAGGEISKDTAKDIIKKAVLSYLGLGV